MMIRREGSECCKSLPAAAKGDVFVGAVVLFMAGSLMVGCGGSNGSNGGSGGPPLVSLSPSTWFENINGNGSATTALAMYSGQTQQFTATVNNNPSGNPAVTWTIKPATGAGKISSSGLYTAPATIAMQQMVFIIATSVAYPTVSGSDAILLEPTVVVVYPPSAALSASQTQQFSATEFPASLYVSNTGVNWTISPATGAGTIDQSGLYTAPSSITKSQRVTVTATLQGNSSVSGKATVALGPPMATLYASPTGSGSACTLAAPCSLTGAQSVVETLNGNMTGNITVNLLGGTYTLTSPLSLSNADSGTNGHKVIWQANPGETPVFEGGQTVTGWTLYDSSLNIYSANVGSNYSRDLYVNGTRQIRARSPNLTNASNHGPDYQTLYQGIDTTSCTVQVPASTVAQYANLSQPNNAPELHWGSHFVQTIPRIASIAVDGSTATITLEANEVNNCSATSYTTDMAGESTFFFVENAMELLDSPGEWYLDASTGTLYYIPASGVDMSTATVTIPVATELLQIQGTSATSPATNITFRGVTFQDTNWTTPSFYGYIAACEGGLCQTDGGTGGGSGTGPFVDPPGTIQLMFIQNINIENNTVQHTGAYGLYATGTNGLTISGNTFTDLADGGIYIITTAASIPTNTATHTLISDNLVQYAGQDYADGVGIWLDGDHEVAQHNEVAFTRWLGIGFNIDPGNYPATSNQRGSDFTIQYNKVHDVDLQLTDAGAIYTWADEPNSVIQFNYVYNLRNVQGPVVSPGAINTGIYLDSTTANLTIYANVVDMWLGAGDIAAGAFLEYAGLGNGIIFEDNYYKGMLGLITSGDTQINQTQVPIGSPWPPAAEDIINGAGTTW